MKSKLCIIILFFILPIICYSAQYLNIQGKLTDLDGAPINGNRTFVFSIYTNSTGGAPIWSETQNLHITNGIYNALLGSVTPLSNHLFIGSPRWLGIKVGADSEMSPRNIIAGSAYAFNCESLQGQSPTNFVNRAGDTMYGHLTLKGITNWLTLEASRTFFQGDESSGSHIFEKRDSSDDTQAFRFRLSDGTGANWWDGIVIESTSYTTGRVILNGEIEVWDNINLFGSRFIFEGAEGADSISLIEKRNQNANQGIYLRLSNTNGSTYWDGLKIIGNSGFNSGHLILEGNTRVNGTLNVTNNQTNYIFGKLYMNDLIKTSSTHFVTDQPNFVFNKYNNVGMFYWRKNNTAGDVSLYTNLMTLDNSGNLTTKGSMTPNGLDIAEYVTIKEKNAEPGDVVVIDRENDNQFRLCYKEYDTAVAGVIASKPGVILGSGILNNKNKRAIAIGGVVPCKVTTINGAITRGDLLVTSPKKGYAMKGVKPTAGSIIGKALQELKTGEGIIKVWVNLE